MLVRFFIKLTIQIPYKAVHLKNKFQEVLQYVDALTYDKLWLHVSDLQLKIQD